MISTSMPYGPLALATGDARAIVTAMSRSGQPPSLAPSIDDIETMAKAAFQEIPGALRRHVEDVVIRVEEFPDDETVEEMGLGSEFELLGLYRGVSLDRRSVSSVSQDVDMIFLYRRPILDYWCETGEPLERIVRHVLIHEIGHHFGFSDEDMEAIENAG